MHSLQQRFSLIGRALGALTLLCLLCAAGVLSLTESNELVDQAELATKKHQYKKAIKLYSQAIEIAPGNADYLRRRGELFLTMDRYDPALRDFTTALSLDIENGDIYYAMARLQYAQKEQANGLWFINRAAQYAKDDETFKEMVGFKGKIHLEQGEYAEAEEHLAEAAMANEVSMDVLKDLALAYHKNGKNELAVEILEEIIDLFGADIEPLVNAGYMSNQIGDYELAISYFDMALEKEPDQPYAMCNKAYSLLQTGQAEEAHRLVKKSLDNDNTNAFAYKVLGDILALEGENKKACKEYTKAVEMGWVLYFDRAIIEDAMQGVCDQ